MLAFSLYFHPNSDMALAEKYANCAKDLGEYVNSTNVLNCIAEKKNTPIYTEAQEENQGKLQHLYKAVELYESLGDWRDAPNRAVVCRTRIEELKEEEIRHQQEEKRIREEWERKVREEREKNEAELRAQKKRMEQNMTLIKIGALIGATVTIIIFIVNLVTFL